MTGNGWDPRGSEHSAPQPPQVQYEPPSHVQPPDAMNAHAAQPTPVAPTGYPAIPPPTLRNDLRSTHIYPGPPGAVLYGSCYTPYTVFPGDGSECTSAIAAGNDDNGIGHAPTPDQAPPAAYPVAPSAHPYNAQVNSGMPSTTPSELPYTSSAPSFYPMAPPPVPTRPPTASSSRSATGAARHRGRAGRMLSRAREHIDNIRERSGPPEVHWSEVDAEGTWVLMFVPAQRGYE